MNKIEVAKCCSNCIHWESTKAVGACALLGKLSHKLEGCNEWQGNKDSITGILNYLKTQGIKREYESEGINDYKKSYIEGEISADERQKVKEEEREYRHYFKEDYQNVHIWFVKSCATCNYCKGSKALRNCNRYNIKVHKREVCSNWEVDKTAIKRNENSKNKRINKIKSIYDGELEGNLNSFIISDLISKDLI